MEAGELPTVAITEFCDVSLLKNAFMFADILKQRRIETQILIPRCDRRSRRSFGELHGRNYQHKVSKNTKSITQYLVFRGGYAHITKRKTSSLAQAVTLLVCIQGGDRPSWVTRSVDFLFSIIVNDDQRDATLLFIYLFPISCTCFGRCLRPSLRVKLKQSRYRSGVAQRVPGS